MNILIPKSRKDDVVRELKENGTLELMEVQEKGIDNARLSDTYPRTSEAIRMIEEALDTFRLVEKKGRGFKERVEVGDENAASILKKFEKKRHVLEKIISIRRELKSLKEREAKLDETEKIASLLQSLNVDPKSLTGHPFVSVFIGKMGERDHENFAKEVSPHSKKIFIKTMPLEGGNLMLAAAVPNSLEESVSKTLNMNGFEPLKIPGEISGYKITDARNNLLAEFESIKVKEARLLGSVAKFLKEKKEFLVLLEMLRIEKNTDESGMLFGTTERTVMISGWTPARNLKSLQGVVKKSAGNACSISSRPPQKGETPPTLVRNAGPAGGLEILTKSYGLPDYNELDPTKIITLTFPIIFGMMFGDVGHGVLLMIAGFAMSRKIPGDGANRLGKTLIVCGVAATFFGFLYGSAFGLTHENTPGMFEPLWMEPLAEEGRNITSFIRFSITIAVVVLSLGCILNIINQGRHSLKHAFFHPWGVLGLWVLLAGANLFYTHGIDFIPLTIMGILGDSAALGTVFNGLVLLVVPLALVPLGEIFVEKKPLVVGLYSIMEVGQTFLVNTISYVRIVIIAVVHGALLLIVIRIMEMVTSGLTGLAGSVLATVIFIGGNVVVFGMEAMIALVQTTRLHYYEFVSKFYRGSGRSFAPFRAERSYTVRRINGNKLKHI
ncbi:MAG: hypothetical protein JSV63_03670 [Candidatus Aenigmatarchaeota archaeon]|nr:MAG: hypothetical protein JSV63_03670 [Candidatus Aenigmarchaeota archaeon]